MMKTLTVTRNKSFEWSIGLHTGLILLALLPFAHKAMEQKPLEYILEIGYYEVPEERTSGSEGLEAKSPVYNEEPQPTTEQPAEEPIPVDEVEPVEEVMIAENESEVISDVTSETEETDVVASETSASGSDTETSANGGGAGSPIEGNQDGAATSGDGGAGDGLEGDGIITRKIVYRENITSVAKVSGRVTLNISIDRQGKVTYAAYDPDKTTITDKEIIKQATYLALRYRYAEDYAAPKKEWGKLTFIFRIDEDVVGK